jgi:hypothetical protein
MQTFPSLPIQLATRLVLDVISYSAPLPPWVDPLTINYALREQTIARKIEKYLGGARPEPSFEIEVPNKGGARKRWSIPSVNDQIILQTCVSVLARKVAQVIDKRRVLSYRYNTDPNRLQLSNNQVDSWSQFQNETQRRLAGRRYLLQLDLEKAFQSVNREDFLQFVENLSQKSIENNLLKILLGSFGSNSLGLPLVNDSLFFLGNAYFSVVDKVMNRHSADFIRFVDDYRIFGESRESLEQILVRVTRDLSELGFKINERKLKLGSGEEYLEAVSKGTYATTKELDAPDYISAVIFADVLEAEQMVGLVERVISNPDEYLNEGFGRLVLGAIRRMRVNDIVAKRKNYYRSPRDRFAELLSENADIVSRTVDLLEKYAQAHNEAWRTIWLMFVLADASAEFMRDKELSSRVKNTVKAIQAAGDVSLVVQLWAKKLFSSEVKERPSLVEELHEAGYLEAGVRLYGGTRDA